MSGYKILVFVLLISLNGYNLMKLNYPRVLLPIFDNIRINFTLSVLEKGCFSWTSSRSDLIQLTPIYDDNECSYEAQVTVITRNKQRNTAIVLAEDQAHGEILRCDVILDLIHQLAVLTTTRELYLEEAPETFELLAQDSQDNAFTTLEGIEFDWKIELQHNTASDSGWHQVLRFLDFAASKYHEVPKDIESFELRGLKGYKVLLEGINTGYAKVAVRLPYPEYRDVLPVEVNIMVLANLIIDPVDSYIMVGDSVDFRILQLKQGKLEEISTSNQYYLEIENTKYAELRGNTATGLELGRTSVILRDKNVPVYESSDETANKPPTPRATLTVAKPAKIALDLLPYHNWVTVEGQVHDIAIDLYTSENQKIKLGSKYKLESTFDTSLFNEYKRNSNGSRIRGEALYEGVNPVAATFQKLSASAEMLIYSKISLEPQLVVLPYDPNKPTRQKVQFVATGGDKSYNWYTSDSNLLQITQNGLAESKLDRLKDGQSLENVTVKVALTRNPKIFETAQVLFLPPIKLEIVGYNFETAVGDYIHLYVGLFALHNDSFVPFASCENLPFDLEFNDHRIFTIERHENPELKHNSCRMYKLRGVQPGISNLRVSYTFGDRVLKDEAHLVVFEKFQIFNPESNQIVLPIGASRNVFYQNGPQKVFNVAADLTKNVRFNKNLIQVQEVRSEFINRRLAYNILCKKVGETVLEFDVYNMLNQKNFIKYVSKYETKVFCVKPRFVSLYTNEKLKTSCPIESKNSLMIVNSGKDSLDIEIEVLDAENRKLDNITSLVIDWTFTQANGVLNHNIAYNREVETDEIDGLLIPKRDYLKTSVPDQHINHKIKAVVKEYNLKVLNKLSIVPETPHFGIQKISGGEFVTPAIENELNFLSFDSALLPKGMISIFLAPSVVESIKTGHGSGYYDIKVIDSNIVDVEFSKQTSELKLYPKSIGNTKVRITDRCLKTETSILEVAVVSVGRIELSTPDRVEKTKSIEAIVRLFDSNGNLLNIDWKNLEIYELVEDVKNPKILQMKQADQIDLGRGEIRYKITGTELGETKIVVSSGSGNRLISSVPATVQVFPPLTLLPRNATILVGSFLEISSIGGPKPDVNIEYQVQNSDILSIDGSVVEGLKVGKSKVVGRCIGRNPSNDNQIVFSEDVIYVNVIPLNGIKIKSPLNRLKSGTVMPASIWGDPDVSPLVLGTLKNFKVRWTTNSQDVIELKGPFDDMGIVYQEKDAISVRVRGLKPGKAKIVATATLGSQKFTAQIEVAVFKTLELESPKRIAYDPILVPPKTSLQLKANLDDAVYELNDEEDINIINVSRDGVVRSGDSIGRSLVIATSVDQKLSIPIEVKNIHYILTTVVTAGVSTKKTEFELPQNLNFPVKVTLHDSLGNEFSHDFDDLNSLRHKLAKSSGIYVNIGDNFTLSVNLLRENANVLEVSLKDSSGVKYSEDYLKLAVKKSDSLLQQKSTFVVGDVICFDSPLSEALSWRTNNEKAIRIDENTGIARVTGSVVGQKVIVSHGKPNEISVDFELDVKEADKIEFIKSSDNFNGEQYRGYFVVSNHFQNDKRSNLVASNQSWCSRLDVKNDIDFVTCKLRNRNNGNGFAVDEKFVTRPVFDKSNGLYACEISLLTTIDDITSITKNKNFDFDLEVRLASGISDSMILKLIPAIKITPRSIYYDNLSKQEIVVSGMENILQKVEVTSSHPDYFSVVQLPKLPGQVQFKTKLLHTPDGTQELFVKVVSPLTSQNVNIPVLAQAPDPVCAMRSSSGFSDIFVDLASNIGKIIAALVVGGTVMFLLIRCYPRDYEQNNSVFQNSKNQNNSSMGIPGTPKNSMFQASPLSSQHSPSLIYKTSPYSPGNISGNSNVSSFMGNSQESPIYGDTTLHSPQKRINRRNL